VVADKGGGFQAKKWFKPKTAGATAAAKQKVAEQLLPPPEHGRLSIFVGNLDPLVAKDNLWQFFWQAG